MIKKPKPYFENATSSHLRAEELFVVQELPFPEVKLPDYRAPLSLVCSAQPMCRGSAVDLGTTPGPGPSAACHSPFPTLFPVTLFKLYYQ